METSLQNFLTQLFSTPSPTSDVAGVAKVQALLASELAALGFTVRYAAAEGASENFGPFLIAERLAGAAPGRFVTFVTHADTVDGFAHEFVIDEARAIVTGQGVLDDKASQVVALWGIRRFLAEHSTSSLSLRFVSSPNEERGSPGFYSLYQQLSADSVLVLGFEPATEKGEIITSRRGNRWYQVSFQGKEAHAGRAPQLGINAAYDMARALAAIEELNRYDEGISISVGAVRSLRDTYNVVCGGVEVKLDFRFASFEARDRVDANIRDILLNGKQGLASPAGTSLVTIAIADDCPPMSRTDGSAKLANLYAEVLPRGRATAIASGGSADVCYMSRPGLPVIDGLGAIGGNMHSTSEWADLQSVDDRAWALARFLNAAETRGLI